MERNLKQELTDGKVLVIDGAMGTMLYSRGVYINRSFDELNLSQPSLVKEIHEEYVKAGVDILMTNTFSANASKLEHYELSHKVKEINEAAVKIAREASQGKTFVGGSVGPMGTNLKHEYRVDEIRAIYQEQIGALISAGVDVIVLETFNDLKTIELAVDVVRDIDPEMPIFAFMSFTWDNTTLSGATPEEVVTTLEKKNVEMIGANCSTGPHAMLNTLKRMVAVANTPVGGMPNAGPPQQVEGRTLYMASPEYLDKYAKRFIKSRVQIVGGCCGTTPEMLQKVVSSKKAQSGGEAYTVTATAKNVEVETQEPVPYEDLTAMSKALAGGEFVYSIELRPPRGFSAEPILKKISHFKEHGIKLVNIPDSPRATLSMSPMALAILIRERLGIESIIHFPCNNRNLLSMHADLLGLHALNIRDVLLVTGDPPNMGNYPMATSVFDVDAIGITRIVDNLNHGLDMIGKPMKKQTSFHNGVGVDPGAVDLEREIDRYIQKVEAGAKYVMTQPVFDPEIFANFMDRVKDYRIKTLVGIQPLFSHKNCEFMHYEVPGVSVPDNIRDIMKKAGSGPQARREGVAIAKDALNAVQGLCDGAYIMASMGNYDMPLAVMGKIPTEAVQ